MMEYEKDYSLLRQFDLEAAKRGELVCFRNGKDSRKFIAGPDSRGNFILQCQQGEFHLCSNAFDGWKMAPLCWVEGKPVYKGDVLYFLNKPRAASHTTTDRDGDEFLRFNDRSNCWLSGPSSKLYSGMPKCTLALPKARREVKLVSFIDDQGSLRWVREELFRCALVRVPSEDKTIVIEE